MMCCWQTNKIKELYLQVFRLKLKLSFNCLGKQAPKIAFEANVHKFTCNKVMYSIAIQSSTISICLVANTNGLLRYNKNYAA